MTEGEGVVYLRRMSPENNSITLNNFFEKIETERAQNLILKFSKKKLKMFRKGQLS